MQVVKIGGSVLSLRERPFAFRSATAHRLVRELGGDQGALLVTHGAGSWGRFFASSFDRPGGFSDARVDAARNLRSSLEALTAELLRAMRSEGLPVASLDPESVVTRDENGRIDVDTDSIRNAMNTASIVVLPTALVRDATGGCHVASSDAIAAAVARGLAARRVVWVTDVDGVASADASGRVLERLRAGERHLVAVEASDATDPTGAMSGKLDAIFELADAQIPSLVVNGNVPGRLERALAGDATAGTLVAP